MLSFSSHHKTGFFLAIDLLGTDLVWSQTKAPNNVATVRCGGRAMGKEDNEYVNTYGDDARIFVGKSSSFPDVPVELDRLILTDGREYVVAAVHEVMYNNDLIGYRMVGRSAR